MVQVILTLKQLSPEKFVVGTGRFSSWRSRQHCTPRLGEGGEAPRGLESISSQTLRASCNGGDPHRCFSQGKSKPKPSVKSEVRRAGGEVRALHSSDEPG